MVHVTAATPLS